MGKWIIDDTKKLGEKVGIDWKKVPKGDLKKGLEIEKEHSRTPKLNVAKGSPKEEAKIALAHIKERPDYYTKLTKHVDKH